MDMMTWSGLSVRWPVRVNLCCAALVMVTAVWPALAQEKRQLSEDQRAALLTAEDLAVVLHLESGQDTGGTCSLIDLGAEQVTLSYELEGDSSRLAYLSSEIMFLRSKALARENLNAAMWGVTQEPSVRWQVDPEIMLAGADDAYFMKGAVDGRYSGWAAFALKDEVVVWALISTDKPIPATDLEDMLGRMLVAALSLDNPCLQAPLVVEDYQSISLLDDKLTFTLPSSMKAMTDEQRQFKYPAGAPKYGFMNEAGTVVVAVAPSSHALPQSAIPGMTSAARRMIQQGAPGARIIQSRVVDDLGKPAVFLEYTVDAPDTRIHNYSYVASHQSRQLNINLNCTVALEDEWAAELRRIMGSMRLRD